MGMGGGSLSRVILTGSSGTIGTRLFERTLELGFDVIGIDRRENRWKDSYNFKTMDVDLLYEDECEKLPTDVDLIVHLAANARVYELVKAPSLALENIISTFNVLEFARKNGINKVILASSRDTYGNVPDGIAVCEEMADIRNCESPYSASKMSSEALVYAYNRVYGINFVVARLSNVYGMYDISDRVIPLWVKQTINNQDLIIYGEGKVLDFVYIDDAVDGLVRIIGGFAEVKNDVFNIAFGKGIKIRYVAERIIALLNGRNKMIIKGNRPGEVWGFEADITKARKLLGYEPKIDIEEGLKRTVQWYKTFYSG